MFSPTPIPEPANPPRRPPQPPPDPTPPDNEAPRLIAVLDFNLLRLVEHAFSILASHSLSPSGPLICVACLKPWRCLEVTWAADWTLAGKRRGFLDDGGLDVSDDILAVLACWGTDIA